MIETSKNAIKRYSNKKSEIEIKYRTLGRRIYAGMIDNVLFFVFAITIELLLQFFDINIRYQIYRISILPFVIIYPIVTTKLFGGTPGKVYSIYVF